MSETTAAIQTPASQFPQFPLACRRPDGRAPGSRPSSRHSRNSRNSRWRLGGTAWSPSPLAAAQPAFAQCALPLSLQRRSARCAQRTGRVHRGLRGSFPQPPDARKSLSALPKRIRAIRATSQGPTGHVAQRSQQAGRMACANLPCSQPRPRGALPRSSRCPRARHSPAQLPTRAGLGD
jgi:hypothetical protein